MSIQFDQLVAGLRDVSQIDTTLDTIKQVLFDREELLIDELATLIKHPGQIKNTHQFASILAEYNSAKFIPNLIAVLQQSQAANSPYLGDYLYALVSVLNSHEEAHDFDDEFTGLLAHWLLQTGGGEVAWKAADILSWNRNPLALAALLTGAKQAALFDMARHACLRGVVNHFPEQAPALLAALLDDENQEIREHAQSARDWLASR